MAYTKTNWQNWPSTATPLSATNLNNMEDVIVQAAEDAADAAASAAELATQIGIPADATVAGYVNNDASSTGTALGTKYLRKTGLDGEVSVLFSGASSSRTALDARYRATNSGTYAARPAATAVTPGSIYVATNVQEMYMSTGSTWIVIGTGGNELGRASITGDQAISATSPSDIVGLTVSWVAGERPAELRFSGGIANNTAVKATDLWFYADGATGENTIGKNQVYTAVGGVYTPAACHFPLPTYTPGTSHSVRVALTAPAGSTGMVRAAANNRTTLQVVSL